MVSGHITIPNGTPVLQRRIVKNETTVVTLRTGNEVHGTAWRLPGNTAVPGAIMPLLETYLLGDPHHLPWNFVSWVSDCASEALINAGKYARPGTDVQVSCYVVRVGDDRRCTVKVFNFVQPDAKLFPNNTKDIPRPDMQNPANSSGRGLPIMAMKADSLVLEDLPGYAKDVTLAFDLKNAPTE